MGTLQDSYKNKISKKDYKPSIEYGIKVKFDSYAVNEKQEKRFKKLLEKIRNKKK